MTERRLVLLACLALACAVAFMGIGLRGDIAFALELRGIRLLALAQVAVAVAVSTVLFQTVTGNFILTPSIMGLDALYVFGQTAMVFLLGGLGFALLDPRLKFAGEMLAMLALALALFLPMLRSRLDLGLMLLTGVVLGVLFRSLSNLVARMIDPNEFAVIQGASFASFNVVRTDLLAACLALTSIGAALAWRGRHALDVMTLGADSATGLGVEWLRTSVTVLLLVAALVAVSTALVGPVAFLGLLVVALAERIVSTRAHRILLPAACLVAVIVLVGGQTVLQHVFGNAATLGIVIELLGGLAFLSMLFAAAKR